MDRKGQPPRHGSQPHAPGLHVFGLLDQLRAEYEALSHEAHSYKTQKDDYERKLQTQLAELGAIQHALLEMERTHVRMKQQYEEELGRYRRAADPHGQPREIQPAFIAEKTSSLPAFASQPLGEKKHSLNGTSQSQPTYVSQSPNAPNHAKKHRPDESFFQPSQNSGFRNMQTIEYRESKSPDAHQISNPTGEGFQRDHRPRTPTVDESDSTRHMKDEKKIQNSDRKYKDPADWSVSKNPSSLSNHMSIDLAHTLDHSSVVCCVKFSGDGRYLATGCNKSAQIFDVETGEKTGLFNEDLLDVNGTRKEGDLYIRSVCFSPDGKYLAAGAEDRTVKVWDILRRRTKHVFTGHELDIYSLDFSVDGRIIVSGSGDRKTKVWNLEKGEIVHTLHNEEVGPMDGVTSISISPDGKLVACGSLDRIVRIWDLHTGALKERLEGHDDSVYSVVFSPDGSKIASGSLDTTVKIWDLHGSHSRGNRPSVTLGTSAFDAGSKATIGHKDFVLSVAFLPDGNGLLSGSKDRTIRFWDLRTANWTTQLQGHKNSVISVAVNPARGAFASGSGDFRTRIWKYNTA